MPPSNPEGRVKGASLEYMEGDGNGWAAGPDGIRVWGRYGAAGLMLLAGSGDQTRVLMQHRAKWTNAGDTWALPGGARDSHETPTQAAIREAVEECSIEPSLIEVLHTQVTAGPYPANPKLPELPGEWTYTTVIARTATGEVLNTFANEESLELRWVRLDALEGLSLMPVFAASLPALRQEVDRLSL